MSCARVRPGPGPGAWQEIPVHVVVRDYPETLAVLRAAGVDVAATGGLPLREVVSDPAALARLERALGAAVAWRDAVARSSPEEAT